MGEVVKENNLARFHSLILVDKGGEKCWSQLRLVHRISAGRRSEGWVFFIRPAEAEALEDEKGMFVSKRQQRGKQWVREVAMTDGLQRSMNECGDIFVARRNMY